MQTTKVLRHIYAALRQRLPLAPISPLTALDLLCDEHPCADTSVAAHLVGHVEGNGILLPLRSLLALLRCGYRRATACYTNDPFNAAISQWGPMEETLFSALYINFRKLREEQDVAWSDILTGDSRGACGDSSLNLLQGVLQLLEDVASFVHYSSLTLKARRLQLLRDVLLHMGRVVEREWSLAAELTHAGNIAMAQLQRLGYLAGRCLRLYGKCSVSCHRVLCEMVLAGASASCEVQRQAGRGEELLRACIARDVLVEVQPLLVGLLSRTTCEMQYWAGSSEKWMDIILQLAENTAADAARLHSVGGSSYCCSSGRILAGGAELWSAQVEVLHALALCLAMYHRTVFAECTSVDGVVASALPLAILRRGFEALQHLLQVAAAAEVTTSGERLHCCSCSLTASDWCKCCEAVEVLHALSVFCTTTTTAADSSSLCAVAHVRGRLLLDALRRLTRPTPSDVNGNGAVVPIAFYVTLVRALQVWEMTPNSATRALLHELWDAARVALPRSLQESQLPTQPVLILLEALSRTPHLEWQPPTMESFALVKVAWEMRANCLTHLFHKVQGNDVVSSSEVLRGLLHIAAGANRARRFTTWDGLFVNHQLLLDHLMSLLLPVDLGLQHLSCHFVGDSYNEEVVEEWDYRVAISGGAYWFLCNACLQAVVWRSSWEDLGSPGLCGCVHRRCDAAETLVAYVEFLTPELMRGRGVGCSDPMEEPFAALRSVHKDANAAATARALLPQKGEVAEVAAPSSPSEACFFVGCHQQLLLLPPHQLLPSHASRMLRALFTTSPSLFAHIPELPLLLLRRHLLPFTTDTNTIGSSEHVRDGVRGVVERADARELWELLLWTCAAAIACVGRSSPLDSCHYGGDQPVVPAKSAANFRITEGEYAEEILCLLRCVDDDSSNALFFTTRQRVLQRALELAECGNGCTHV